MQSWVPAMVQANRYQNLPTSNELPDSDDTPVDNEDQNLLPNYLLFLLKLIWADRQDWYFGVATGSVGGDYAPPSHGSDPGTNC